MTPSLILQPTAIGATAEINEWLSSFLGLQCNGKCRDALRRQSESHEHRSMRLRDTTVATSGAKRTDQPDVRTRTTTRTREQPQTPLRGASRLHQLFIFLGVDVVRVVTRAGDPFFASSPRTTPRNNDGFLCLSSASYASPRSVQSTVITDLCVHFPRSSVP